MRQIALFQLPVNQAKAAAIKLIKHYVLRGDTFEQLKAGRQGSMVPYGMYAQIGGYLQDVKCKPDEIIVFRDMDGKEVNQKFKLMKIMSEIREEAA